MSIHILHMCILQVLILKTCPSCIKRLKITIIIFCWQKLAGSGILVNIMEAKELNNNMYVYTNELHEVKLKMIVH